MTQRACDDDSLAASEENRLREVDTFRIESETLRPRLEEFLRIAAAVFHTPVAYVSLIERGRQRLCASMGLTPRDLPRCQSFCDHTIRSERVFTVADARADHRFARNPLVTSDPGVRFYAGAPLVTTSGLRIGALCIADTRVRKPLSIEEEGLLKDFANLAIRQLEFERVDFTNRTIHAFTEASALALLISDREGRILFVNRATEVLSGYSRSDLVGNAIGDLFPERFRHNNLPALTRLSEDTVADLSGKVIELTIQHRDGHEIPVEFSFSVWRRMGGLTLGAVLRDISSRRQRDARLLRLAHHDPLTGLANRTRFASEVRGRIEAGDAVSVMMIDLDGFKEVNDSVGHEAGDTLLQAIAVRFNATLGSSCLLGRWGGDEFVVLLSTADPSVLQETAQKLLGTFAEPFDLAGRSLVLGASIGGATWPLHGCDCEELVASADLAQYRAKTSGGRRFKAFESSMRDDVIARRMLHDDVRRAHEAGELVLYYQPQVELRSGRVVGAEALLRWQHPERGLILPGAFLSAVGSGSLALQIGWWAINEACRQASTWREGGHPSMTVSVNLFAAQLHSGNLVEVVEKAIQRHGLPGDALELEVTETIALQHDEGSHQAVRALHDRGVGIAFDDFGTGYASLSTLRRYPLTTLKLDRSFVQDLPTNKPDDAIVWATITMARALGLKTIAEGIETPAQERRLAALKCDVGQGFRYGQAMAPADFREWLNRWDRSRINRSGSIAGRRNDARERQIG